MWHIPCKLRVGCHTRRSLAEIQRGFLREGLREETLTDGDSLDQSLSPASGSPLRSTGFQLVRNISGIQPSPKMRRPHMVLVHRKEWNCVTARTNGVLRGRKRGKTWHCPRKRRESLGDGTTGRDSTALSLVNCPALQMSPEDTATIIIRADTQSDYTFWLAWWPWLSLKQKQLGGGGQCADLGPGFQRRRNYAPWQAVPLWQQWSGSISNPVCQTGPKIHLHLLLGSWEKVIRDVRVYHHGPWFPPFHVANPNPKLPCYKINKQTNKTPYRLFIHLFIWCVAKGQTQSLTYWQVLFHWAIYLSIPPYFALTKAWQNMGQWMDEITASR